MKTVIIMQFRIYSLLVLLMGLTGYGFAQNVEIGGFASYGNFDLQRFPSSAVGVGGRLDINLFPYVALEGEGSYDFKHPRVEIVGNGAGSFDVTSLRLGIVHGNGGLKFQTKGGSYFLFVKGGVIDFQPEIQTTTLTGTLISNELKSETSFTKGVFYPGGGIGFHAGLLGMRVDAGDEIYWNNGAKHNLRVTFGPTIRF